MSPRALLVAQLAARNRADGFWIVSGPTENNLYRLRRGTARTAGEGHARGSDRVLESVSNDLALLRCELLPLPLPLAMSLFEVALLQRM